MAAQTGASISVVELFAVLHDSCRENEDVDPWHGRRAADLARKLHGEWFSLSRHDLDALCHACAYHSDGLTEGDPTVQTCWDADRLDLGRVGIRPLPRYLCTNLAKQPAVLEEAHWRALNREELIFPATSLDLA